MAGVTETTLQKYLHELCVAVVKVLAPTVIALPCVVRLCLRACSMLRSCNSLVLDVVSMCTDFHEVLVQPVDLVAGFLILSSCLRDVLLV